MCVCVYIYIYIYDVSHVIQLDDLEVRDNLTVETWPVRI